MNNRQTSFSNNEWIHQKTNIRLAQYSPNVASTYNMRPPYRPFDKFNKEHNATNNKPEASRFNSQFHERPASQTSSATVNYPPNQNAIYSPRLIHGTQANFPSHQIEPNFHISQDMRGSRHETQIMSADVPTSNRFSKIPCNLASVPSSDRNHNAYPIKSNVRMQSISHHNTSDQHLAYRLPPANQTELSPTPNSINDSFIRQPPPNMPEFIRQPLQPNSSASTFIRPPPQIASNVSGFIRPPFPQNFNNPDTVRHAVAPGSNNPNLIRQLSIPGSGNPDFIRQPSSLDSSNPDFKRQSAIPGSSNPDFVRQPSPLDFNKPDFIRESSVPRPVNSDFVRQPSPLIEFNKPDFVRQPPPLGPIMQPPPNLPSSNIHMPSGSLSSGNFPCPLQVLPTLPTVVTPPFATLQQESHLNIAYGPNLSMPPPSVNQDWLEENKINKFLQRFTQDEKSSAKFGLTITEFHNKLKDAFVTVRELMELKASLLNLLDGNENAWNEKLKEVSHYKDKLTKECNFLSEPKVLNFIQERLKSRKRKRELKKKIRDNKLEEKTKKLAAREELHQTTDKWLESLKEKNLKLKREAEMKKEADSILAEVRRKIHEAKRTIDKIKVFEKLRSARHANAVKKGLFLPDHDKRFEVKISELKATLYKQLSDYESEEKALKVMLEAEQEGQLEEEALWRIKKLRTAQQRRQKNIIESLFGNEEEPTEEDPIFLFHQFQNSGNKSIESLVQIRHHWDLHLNKDGETVPSQWVVPVPPSSAVWEFALR